MSRGYRYQVSIEPYSNRKIKDYSAEQREELRVKLNAACPDLHSFTYWGVFESFGDVTIGGGRSTYEFAEEQTRKIFRALGEPAEVYWCWWYEEREPDDTDSFNEDDYSEWLSPLEQLAEAADDE